MKFSGDECEGHSDIFTETSLGGNTREDFTFKKTCQCVFLYKFSVLEILQVWFLANTCIKDLNRSHVC